MHPQPERTEIRQRLIKDLWRLVEEQREGVTASQHCRADFVLLAMIGSETVSQAFEAIEKRY